MEKLSNLQKRELFKGLHYQENILLLPNAWDAGTAVLMESLGFAAIATTSAGIAFANGFADNEIMGKDRMLEAAAKIIERVQIPVSVDLETGYGNSPAEVATTIRQAIAIGAAGANIEDTRLLSSELLPVKEASERILAAKEAINNYGDSFVLNARIDTFFTLKHLSVEACLSETILRANSYAEAGADCIFVPGVSGGNTIKKLVEEIPLPVNLLGAYSGIAPFSVAGLQEMGVNRITIGGSLALLAFAEVKTALEAMKEQGQFTYASRSLTNGYMNLLMRN